MIGDLSEGIEARREELVLPDPCRCYPKNANDRKTLESGSMPMRGFHAKASFSRAIVFMWREPQHLPSSCSYSTLFQWAVLLFHVRFVYGSGARARHGPACGSECV